MTHSNQLVLFVLFLIPLLAIWLIVFRLLPAVATARFQRVMSELRDECEDLQLDGHLPIHRACVDDFVSRADILVQHAHGFTVLDGYCAYRAARDVGYDHDEPDPSYWELAPAERKLMHELDRRMQAAIRLYLLTGSITGWATGLVIALGRTVTSVKTVREKAPTARRLAKDYEDVVVSSGEEPPHRTPLRRALLLH